MAEELVLIARFSSEMDAELAKGRLHAENIPALISTDPSAEAVELLVPESAANDAIEILDAGAAAAEAEAALHFKVEESEERCMICQASFVEKTTLPLPVRALRALLLSFLPFPSEWFESRARRCGVCGYRWKQSTGESHDPSGVASAEHHRDRVPPWGE